MKIDSVIAQSAKLAEAIRIAREVSRGTMLAESALAVWPIAAAEYSALQLSELEDVEHQLMHYVTDSDIGE